MPKGKAPISGARGWAQQPLSMEEIISACRDLLRRKNMPEPTRVDIEICAREIDETIRRYLAFQATPMLTATQRQRLLNKVVTAARKLNVQLVSRKNVQSAVEKLLQLLLDIDVNTSDVIHKHLRRAGFEKGVIGLQLKLQDGSATEVEDEVKAMLDRICTLEDWTDKGPNWPNPLLVNLVHDLAPVWQKLTGLSPRTVDPELGEHPFAEWTNKLLDLVREKTNSEKDSSIGAGNTRCC